MATEWVYEVKHVNYSEWLGNLLYDDLAYAKFCAEQDYREFFGEPEHNLHWDFVCKGLYHMYDGDLPTDVELRVRHINSLGE